MQETESIMPQVILTHSQNLTPSDSYVEQQLERWGLDATWQHQFESWDNLWQVLRTAVFQKSGAEIAQVGSTWVSGLLGMQALRPFTVSEVLRIQQAGNFLPVAWNSAEAEDDTKKRVWAIPWSSDARVMYYWEDMFEQARIDPEAAFSDPRNFEDTLERLQASGFETPWVACTAREVNTVHHICMWIWQYGGEILSPNGREVRFTEPAALAAIEAYFRLHRFIPDTPEGLTEADVLTLFQQRKAACILSGTWVVTHAMRADADLFSRLGAALPPAPPYVGGTNLVVMNHLSARHEQSAIDLIVRLSSEEFLAEFAPMAGYDLPVRTELFEKPPFSNHPFIPVLSQALQTGRSIPNLMRWGIVEDELKTAFHKIWMDIKNQPDQALDVIIANQLEPLAVRLKRMLAV